MVSIHDRLRDLRSAASGWTEFRYHDRRTRVLAVKKGEVSEMSSRRYGGVGIRVLLGGAWGFASTSDLSRPGLERALAEAESMARELAGRRRKKTELPGTGRLARGEFAVPGFDELLGMELECKFDLVRRSEEKLRTGGKGIESAVCRYSEIFEDKIILTTDGADCRVRLARPELRFIAFAEGGGGRAMGKDSVGATGGWECLFRNRSVEEQIENATSSAVELLGAPPPEGGRKKVILSPAMVGLLSHEAIGHTVEADLVAAGSVVKGKIGQEVASGLVTLCDSGRAEHQEGAGGLLPVDDEGVVAGRTEIIRAGKLVSYLHNRESAAEHGVEPTGNARAWEYDNEPLIRMRNTYLEPGDADLEEMIAGIEDGYFVDGPEGGQADSTAEFMFGADKVRRIRHGRIAEHVNKVTVSGNAFDVLRSVDAVSRDFRWDLGAGYCGKGQPAKVDAGGPYIRCELLVGGAQR